VPFVFIFVRPTVRRMTCAAVLDASESMRVVGLPAGTVGYPIGLFPSEMKRPFAIPDIEADSQPSNLFSDCK